jgi:hypothetical protein
MDKSYCPTPLHARAKLRLEGFLNSDGTEVVSPPQKVLTVEEEGSPLTGRGVFEKLILSGPNAGLYLQGVITAFKPPFSVSFDAESRSERVKVVGLEIVREGKMPAKDRYGRWTNGIRFTEVAAITREL